MSSKTIGRRALPIVGRGKRKHMGMMIALCDASDSRDDSEDGDTLERPSWPCRLPLDMKSNWCDPSATWTHMSNLGNAIAPVSPSSTLAPDCLALCRCACSLSSLISLIRYDCVSWSCSVPTTLYPMSSDKCLTILRTFASENRYCPVTGSMMAPSSEETGIGRA